MKTAAKGLLIVLGSLITIVLIILFILFVLFPAAIHPPRPVITYCEFPFTLIYELNGETEIIEDTAICEFDGYGELSSAGQNREWEVYLKSKKNSEEAESTFVHVTLLDLRNQEVYDDFGNEVLELYFFVGNGHYYMGDTLGNLHREPQSFDEVHYMYKHKEGCIGYSSINSEVAFEKYKIKIMDWTSHDPIPNAYKKWGIIPVDK